MRLLMLGGIPSAPARRRVLFRTPNIITTMANQKETKFPPNTFIVVPNYPALEGIGPFAQLVYMWLSKHINNNLTCFPSIKRLQKLSSLSRSSVIRGLKELRDRKLISWAKQTKDGAPTSNLYQIHLVETQKTSKGVVSTRQEVVSDRHEGMVAQTPGVVSPTTTNSIPINSNHINSVASDAGASSGQGEPVGLPSVDDEPFKYKVAIKKLLKAKSHVHNIAGFILMKQGYSYDSEKQFKNSLGRALNSAKSLEGYSPSQITATVDVCIDEAERLHYSWTPETVCKKIAQVVNGDVYESDDYNDENNYNNNDY